MKPGGGEFQVTNTVGSSRAVGFDPEAKAWGNRRHARADLTRSDGSRDHMKLPGTKKEESHLSASNGADGKRPWRVSEKLILEWRIPW
jgi:hypothetical protein